VGWRADALTTGAELDVVAFLVDDAERVVTGEDFVFCHAPISQDGAVRHVLLGARLFFVRPASPPERPDEALLFLGDDQEGKRVEVVGVELADGKLRVIHEMPMRPSYADLYEEAKAWLP